ncbi:hypothetical protein P3T76_012230 [Phytophthora citrophthora]|uniref:Uncharacterized protein n=1 Tax=Phytophthora citrophthora TaxID=4793 RepID=A0AAD9G5I6_9STRA|nr:hypothetical protein P3T76_012230 [Phytophthora citrophthora]
MVNAVVLVGVLTAKSIMRSICGQIYTIYTYESSSERVTLVKKRLSFTKGLSEFTNSVSDGRSYLDVPMDWHIYTVVVSFI